MTRYEQGFLAKCAEYGIKEADASILMANYGPEALAGTVLGGGMGALLSRKNKLRNALLWALAGGGAAVAARYGLAGKSIQSLNKLYDTGVAKGYYDPDDRPRLEYGDVGWRPDWTPEGDQLRADMDATVNDMNNGQFKTTGGAE